MNKVLFYSNFWITVLTSTMKIISVFIPSKITNEDFAQILIWTTTGMVIALGCEYFENKRKNKNGTL